MKKITILVATTVVAFSFCFLIASCKKEPVPIVFNAFVDKTAVDSGAVVTFTDESTGVTSRTWTFPVGTPNTSTDAIVSVSFLEGPVTAKIVDVFHDGTSQDKEFKIQVGKEMFGRGIFGFEHDSALVQGKGWKIWNAGTSPDVTMEMDKTQGASITSRCLKVTITKTLTNEAQIFTMGNKIVINAVLEPNKDYTYSFWVKGEASFVGVNGFDSDLVNQNQESWGNGLPVQEWKDYAWRGWFPVTATWTKISKTFNSGDKYDGQNAFNAYAWYKFEAGLPAGIIYIDEISLKPR